MENRKIGPFRVRVELASGDEATLRPLTSLDFMGEGAIPLMFEESAEQEDKKLTDMSDSERDLGVLRLKRMLLRGIVRYHFKQEDKYTDMKVVDKEPSDTEDNEISVNEIPDHVQLQLVDEIRRASGAPDVSTFPVRDGLGEGTGPDVPQVGQDAGGPPVTAPMDVPDKPAGSGSGG